MFEVRKIEFLEGLYATSDGRILDSEYKEVKKWIGKGYYRIYYNYKKYDVHRLIAIVFIPNPDNKSDVHHINFDKLDNRVENLLWLSKREHTILHQKGKHHSEETKRKIGETNSKQVYQYTLDKELVAIWPSTAEVGRNGFCQESVAACCNGKRKTCGGYIWSYTELKKG